MREKMRAQVFYEPKDMRLEEVDIPEIGEDEVLIKVRACGVCGSDIAYYYGLSPLETETGKGPLILGHEFAGEVSRVGKIPRELGLFQEGDEVTVEPVQYCNTCEVCKRGMVNLCENKTVLGVSVDGAFAEYVKSKYTHLHKLPPGVSFEQASFTEPLANAVYGLNNLQVNLGNFCVIFGPGPIGNMMVQLAKSRGAGKVTLVGTRDYRLKLGKDAGADILINVTDEESDYYVADLVEKIKKESRGRMADRVICATGSVDAMQDALKISGRAATIVYFGLPSPEDVIKIPALDSLIMDKTIRFSWLSPLTWPEALQSIADGLVDVKKLVSHRFSLEDTLEGLENVKNRKDNAMKGLVIFS